jgi:hypothetical protein
MGSSCIALRNKITVFRDINSIFYLIFVYLHMLIQEVLNVEGLLTHGALEGLAVGGQVTLQFHLTGKTLRTEQAPIRLGQVKMVHAHVHLQQIEQQH